MTQEMILSKITGVSTNGINYSAPANAFVGSAFTSAAGNTYFNMMRFGEGIIIKEDVGEGYKYTFLNGLKVYSLRDKTLIADETYHSLVYHIDSVKQLVMRMLLAKLKESSEQQGFNYDTNEAEQMIRKIINDAFNIDQRDMAKSQLIRLNA